MNEVIGPIHQWLYNKIIMQESINMQIFNLAEEMQWIDTLKEKTNDEIGIATFGQLEAVADKEDVHGWLQKRVELVENRFAFAVMTLLKEDASRLEAIEHCLYKFGTHVVLKNANNAVEVAAEIDALLLNGMPCDGAMSVIEKNEEYVKMEITKLIHESYWEKQGGTNEIYEQLIDSFIQGVLSKSEYLSSREGKIRKIFRK